MFFMGLPKQEASKANTVTDNGGNLPNLLSVQRQRNEAGKTGIATGKTRSLSVWRTLSKEKQLEEIRQQRSKKEQSVIKETTLARAMGLPLMKELQNKAQAVPSEDASEGSTNCSSDDKENQYESLLWVSEPRFMGDTTRQFDVTIGRSSTKQRFGLTFIAKADGKLIIAEDAKQFGIIKGDVVLSINGCSQLLTVEKSMGIMKSSLKVELSLLRIAHDSQINQGKPLASPIDRNSVWITRQGVRCVDLLTVSPQQPLPAGPEDQFIIRLSRATLHLKFGLDLRSVNRDLTGRSLTSKVYCAEDMPHLGLKKDDHILSINGCAFTNVTECQRLLDASMSVELLLQRHGRKTSDEAIEWNPQNFAMSEENYDVEATMEEDWMLPDDELNEPIVCVPKISIL